MVSKVLNLALLVTCVSGIHVISPVIQPDYISPQATGYIYRSDNGGPTTLIQLGAPYQQPHQFAPPIPVGHPLVGPPVHEQVYEHNIPAPLPYVVAAQPIVVTNEDFVDDGVLDHGLLHHGHEAEKGGGSDYGEEHHEAQGEKGSKGYKSHGHHAKAKSGHYGDGHEEGFYVEKGGAASGGHNEAQEHGAHHASGKSYQGGDHGHKKHFSKGEDVEGYHKVFNKDEFKKDHDFYDTSDDSGHFNKHGYEKGHHGSEEGGHKEGGQQEEGHDEAESGKAGFHAKGQSDESDLGHSAEEGNESDYAHEEEYAKKEGGGHGKEYGYADDDDDYDY